MADPVRIQKVTEVAVADVIVGARHRVLSQAGVDALAVSIAAEGLQSPIVVRQVPKKGSTPAHFVLIAGEHRLAAAQALGWETIPATAYECSAKQARAMEIDENLIRRELSPLDLAVGLSERKELHEELHPETRNGSAGGRAKNGVQNDKMSFCTFSAIAAANLDCSVKKIERLVKAGKMIRDVGVDAFRVSDEPVTVGDLALFTGLVPAAREEVSKLLSKGVAKTIPEAVEKLSSGPKPAARSALSKVATNVRRFSAAEREEFVEDLFDTLAPVFEKVKARREAGE